MNNNSTGYTLKFASEEHKLEGRVFHFARDLNVGDYITILDHDFYVTNIFLEIESYPITGGVDYKSYTYLWLW